MSSPSLDSCWASWLQEAQEPNKTTVEMLEVRGLSTEHVLQSTLCLVGPRKAACHGCCDCALWADAVQPWLGTQVRLRMEPSTSGACALRLLCVPAGLHEKAYGDLARASWRSRLHAWLVCPSSQVLTKFLLLALLCVCLLCIGVGMRMHIMQCTSCFWRG